MSQTMPHVDSGDGVGDRKKWILCLLFAPDEKGNHKPLYGRTRIMKAAFLLDRKLKEHFDVDTDFEFEAHKYGPFDQGVYIALEQLTEEGLIRVVSPEEHDGKCESEMYSLTDEGKRMARRYYGQLPPGERRLVGWVKYTHSMRPLGSLLSYVYMQYPKMTTESVLK